MRVAVSNFKGGVGKTVVAQHLANAAALDGYRVLCVDFDPQATLTHSMGLTEVKEWKRKYITQPMGTFILPTMLEIFQALL